MALSTTTWVIIVIIVLLILSILLGVFDMSEYKSLFKGIGGGAKAY
jgi:DNA-binding transcriptional regulator of glucitol operon